MARKRKSTSTRRTRSQRWRGCEGVNNRTGRIKKGYRARKGGGCPTKVRARR